MSARILATLGPSLRELIADGPEPRSMLAIPVGCPLPAGQLASWAAESEEPLACHDCAFLRTVELGPDGTLPRPDGQRYRYGFCTAPERGRMALVDVAEVTSRTRFDTDERVLACIEAGVAVAPQIARMTGLSPRVVWKSVRRLKGDGLLRPDFRLHRGHRAA